jgi:hypothetical protein
MKNIYTKRLDGKRCVTGIYWSKSFKDWTATFTESEFKSFLKSHGIKLIVKDFNAKIIHKKHPRERQTWCGIKYDDTIMHKFIPNQLAGHWRKVTCKNCLKLKGAEKNTGAKK